MLKGSKHFAIFVVLVFVGFLFSFFLFPKATFSKMITTSVHVQIVAPTTTTTTIGGGGGGGGYTPPPPPTTKIIFTGKAYPKSTVTLLKDTQVVAATVAGSAANFQMSLSNITPGSYIFSLYSKDNEGNRSSLLTFPLTITSGVTINVTGIFISPTIGTDKIEVKRGEDIAIFGQSVPKADIIISVNSKEDFFGHAVSDKDGIYLYHFDTSVLDYGTHYTKAKASLKNILVSNESQVAEFKVGDKNILRCKKGCGKADLNCDGRVNLVDFSIAAYWYHRVLGQDFADLEKERLNGDKKVDLVDFSIMAYYWTG